jgi:hypothetical protein
MFLFIALILTRNKPAVLLISPVTQKSNDIKFLEAALSASVWIFGLVVCIQVPDIL